MRSLAEKPQSVRQVEPEDNTLPPRFNQKQLAKRLGVAYNAIRLHRDGKAKETLEVWSARKDPDGIGWKYLPGHSKGWDNFYAPAEEGEDREEYLPGKSSQAA